ncbi:hypothetical protein A3A49_01230 [Candidatus Curtissbacteria bacterium RIFCSPLOWO2_01_FULL_38_11b]|uniref:Uncharacterized protein n=1 Tax=Candidatus Curtissbacteria bacterium RIFCSPLOWO2_01_FULL_38_11b TaxID=1797725 RepID=A0A1F5H2L7_9BACT|nr:MAG: hypothetical protein A3A49_01230 [Candidatus Curtissbacteria bacterium RIFCSPLOWO2_01_FULL_38_11b]
MEDLLKLLISPLVSDIKKIKIEKSQDGRNINFSILIPKDDIAKVIGKNGKMIKSIKNILRIRGVKENSFVNIEVNEV